MSSFSSSFNYHLADTCKWHYIFTMYPVGCLGDDFCLILGWKRIFSADIQTELDSKISLTLFLIQYFT